MTNDVIEHITLELKREKYKHTISAKKNDTNARRVQAIITDNGTIVELDDVAMAVVKAIKPDGTHIYNDCTISGNTIWFVMTQQMIAAAGDVTCEIEITWEDNTVISTPTFTIHVYDTVRTGVESTNEYNGIIQAMNEAVQSKNMAAISEENAEASALSASESASAAADSEQVTEENKDYIVEYVNNFVVHNKFAYPSSLDEFPDLSIDEDEEGSYTKVNWVAWPLTNTPLAAELFNHMDAGIANLYDAVDGIKDRLDTDEDNISDLQTSVGGIEDDVDDIEDDIKSINGKIGDTTSMVVPSATDLVGGLNTTYNLAAQKGEALSYLSYSAMVTALNSAATGSFKVGQSVYIGTLEVPDLWIYSEEQTSVPYTYTTDQALIDAVNLTGTLQIGLYKIAFLETQKVEVPEELSDLTDVAISSPTNKQGLIFNGTSNKWENADIEGLPSNVITYAQFIQMSDAEQLAFTGYVTDYPGIDDAPTASDTVFDNTGTDLVSNNVNDAIVEVFEKTTLIIEKNISNVSVSTQWGQLYTSSANVINIESLGFSNIPTILSCVFIPSDSYIAWSIIAAASSTRISVQLIRGSSANVSGKIVLQLKKEI